jgi:dihydrofolate reductase
MCGSSSSDPDPASERPRSPPGDLRTGQLAERVLLAGACAREHLAGHARIWFVQFIGQDWEAWAEVELAEAQGAEALLLGRRSDEYFATRSSSQSGEWVDRLNSLPKYVVSSTLKEPKWTNATVLRGEVVSEVSKLKQQTEGEIVVYASRPLVHTLMEYDLIDELRLTVFPVVLGAGERLFGETSDKRPLRLIHTKAIGNGLAHLTYERAREA